jgi:antitoxin (DNA-binding transcriptional repressor) of toxin-antitoxin stability system
MEVISVQKAKADFPSLLSRVEAGEIIRITRQNRVVAEIRPASHKVGKRKLGQFPGEFPAPDSAFEPLTDDELKDWLGN